MSTTIKQLLTHYGAIDFLLTGRISRLTGKGTGVIKLDRHGTHIDHEPKEAQVRAVVSIPSYPKPIEIKRSIATPGNLEYNDDEAKKCLGLVYLYSRVPPHDSKEGNVNLLSANSCFIRLSEASKVPQLSCAVFTEII